MSDYYGRKDMPTIYYSGKSVINPDDRETPDAMKQLSKTKHYAHPDFFEGPAPSPVTSDDVLRANINLYNVDDIKTQRYFSDGLKEEQEDKRKRVQFDLFSNQYDNLSSDGWARGKYAEQTSMEEKIAKMRMLNERPFEAAVSEKVELKTRPSSAAAYMYMCLFRAETRKSRSSHKRRSKRSQKSTTERGFVSRLSFSQHRTLLHLK